MCNAQDILYFQTSRVVVVAIFDQILLTFNFFLDFSKLFLIFLKIGDFQKIK